MLKKRCMIGVMLFVVMVASFFNTTYGKTDILREKDAGFINILDYHDVCSNILYHPCVNLGNDFKFDISIKNFKNNYAGVYLKSYDKDGNILNSGPNTIQVLPFETKIISQKDLPEGITSLEIKSSIPISSDIYFYSLADGKLSVLSAVAGFSKQLDFPILFEGDSFNKELALFNVQSLPANLEMIVFDKNGEKLTSINLKSLNSKSSIKLSPIKLLNNDILEKLSTIRIEASQEMIGIQMVVNCLDQMLYCFPALFETGSNWITKVPEGIEFIVPSNYCGIFNPGQTSAFISIDALDKTLNSVGAIRTLNLAPHSLYFFRSDDEDVLFTNAYALKLRSDSPIKAFRIPLITDSNPPAYKVITNEKEQTSTLAVPTDDVNVTSDNSLSSIQAAVINCELCLRTIPSDGFDNPVMGTWNGYSDWYIYCTFNDDYCGGGAYCDHTGEDWNLKSGGASSDLGAPVYAVSNGKVVGLKNDMSFGYQILIQHSDILNATDQNVWSQYSHLQSLPSFKIGDSVYRGQKIGNIGKTGTTSPHLHFETRVRNYSISGWPASGYRSNCSKALEFLNNAGYRSPTNVINNRRYNNRTDRINTLMQQYRNLGIINNTLNRYYVEKRDSFIAILIRALETQAGKKLTEAADPYFTDLPHDAGLRSAILKALQLGIISKSADRKFNPGKPITRIEAVTFAVKTYETYRGNINYASASYFSDILVVNTSDSQWWIYNYAQKGYAAGLVTGYVDGTNRWLCPLKFTVREDAVAFVSNLINKLVTNSVPTISFFTINNGTSTTNNRIVSLNNSTSGNPTHYRASQNSTFSDATWQSYSSAPSYTLSTGDGLKTVYFQVKNSYGTSTIKSDTITLNTSDAAPYCQNAVLPSSVTIPNRIYFSGYANDDKGLKTIAMYVSGPKGNDLLAFSTSVSGTSLNLSSYYFDSNNSYYAGVAGTYTIKLMIQDTASQVTYCIFYVVVSSSVDQKPYFQNPSLSSSVTIPNRIYFSGYAYDDKGLKTITMMISGPRGNNITAFSTSVSGTSLNLSSYYFDSNNTNYAGMAGNYTIALWIKDTADQTASVVFNVIVNNSVDEKPYFQNPSLSSSVTIPNRIYFSGYAYDDKGLKTITMMVSGPRGNNLTAFSTSVSGTIVNLSSYYFDSNNTNYAGIAGNYTVALWIKDTIDQTASAVFSVQVKAPVPSYSVSSSYTSNGGGTWGSILKLSASLSGTNLTLTVTKVDGSAWTSSGTVYFKIGTYEPYGANRVQYSVYAGATSFSYTHNLLDYQGQYPKIFYVRCESSSGGYAWVGPITVTEY